MADGTTHTPIRFTGSKYLAQRLTLATLSGRPIRISQIRASSTSAPGVAPHEVSFLRLLESVTNGSHIELSYTGTTVLYNPGLITGSGAGLGASNGVIEHEIPRENTRGISYFLTPLCQLAPFSKAPLNVLFTGPGVITSATPHGDVSADTVRTALLPLLAQFGISNNIELRIVRRSSGAAARGPPVAGAGGEVQLVFGHQVRLPKTLHLLNPGRVKRVRGVAYSTGVAAANNARMVEAARGVLNPLCPDTYVFSDVSSAPLGTVEKGPAAGAKRRVGVGFGLSLVAESNTSCLYSADVASPPEGGITPEEVGRQCAMQLLDVIGKGGCANAVAAPVLLTLMAMGSEDVGRLQLGRDVVGSEGVVALARDLRQLGMSGWGLRDVGGFDEDEDDEDEGRGGSGDVVVSVVGRGVGNVGRKIA